MERFLQRDRAVVLLSLAILSMLAWIYLVVLARGMAVGNMGMMGFDDAASGTADAMMATMSEWSLTTFILMLTMWWVMMVGMMLPSAAPMILLFAVVTRQRTAGENPHRRIALFTASYLAIWAGFSVAATLAQWALTNATLLSPTMQSSSEWLIVTLLAVCGAYQLTPLKQACLGKCRSPLNFLMTRWQPGDLGAIKIALSHGAYCLGCCWMLMTLLFVGGVMNLAWVAVLAVFVLIEKVVPRGDLIGQMGGVAMLVLAVYLGFSYS